ncbi:hypothetical protein [Algivirga pacifica]|uniref:hypothetical protein n=1 Tax=Algivirga pacifica TaxID=1162670 RepID=UPI0031EEAD3B
MLILRGLRKKDKGLLSIGFYSFILLPSSFIHLEVVPLFLSERPLVTRNWS